MFSRLCGCSVVSVLACVPVAADESSIQRITVVNESVSANMEHVNRKEALERVGQLSGVVVKVSGELGTAESVVLEEVSVEKAIAGFTSGLNVGIVMIYKHHNGGRRLHVLRVSSWEHPEDTPRVSRDSYNDEQRYDGSPHELVSIPPPPEPIPVSID